MTALLRNRPSQELVPAWLLLLSTCLPAQTTTQATKQPIATRHPFLWRIDGKGQQTFAVKSWLYGTMHWGDERLVTLPDPVEKARASADAVYCEVERDHPQRAGRMLRSKMFLPKGQTLKDLLPRDLYRELSRYVAAQGAEMRTVDRMRVWAANMSLDWIARHREKMNSRLDAMIWADAKAAGKEVGGLETLDEQLRGREALSKEDQIKMLSLSLDYMQKLAARGVSPTRRLLDVYLSGDETKIMALIDDALGEGQEKLITALNRGRNVRMAGRMAKMMAEHPGKSYFFAVGVLHYIGTNAVVDLLRSKGYRIQRIGAPGKVRADTRPATTKRRRRWL